MLLPITMMILSGSVVYCALVGVTAMAVISRIIVLLYGVWYLYSFRWPIDGQFASKWVAHSAFIKSASRHVFHYFSMRIIHDNDYTKSRDEDPTPMINCFHPHGVYAFSMALASTGNLTDIGGRIPLCMTMNVQFYIPVYREIMMLSGYCCSNKKAIVSLLRKGYDISMSPGGAMEARLWEPSTFSVYINNRKGLFEIALEENVKLVPVLVFGETELYKRVSNKYLHALQEWIYSKTKVFPLLFYGRFASLVPLSVPLTVVVGSPLENPMTGSPPERIALLKANYIDQVTKLHEKYKHLAPNGTSLIKIY